MSTNMWPFEKDLTKETNDRCFPVAREILKIIGNNENLLLGSFSQKEANKEYKDLVQNIKQLMLDNKLLLSDVNYILKVILQPIDAVKYILNENFNKLLEDAEKKFWGKERGDISIEDLDNILK